MMELCRQWFIYGKINEEPPIDYNETNKNQPMYDPENKYGNPIKGGINNGYDEQELSDFWVKMEGYASYLFNLSHAVSYSFITIACAYLKKYHTKEYMANLLSITEKEEDKEKYIEASEKLGIKVVHPDINKSEINFAVKDGKIIYGLSSIKGVGENKIIEIINNRPYKNLSDIHQKLSKKILDKRVGKALIKAGCFDFENSNRISMLNQFIILRNIKKELEEELEDENSYNKTTCMQFERETLSTEITHKPWWKKIKSGNKICENFTIETVSEIYDKNKKLMAFATGESNGCMIEMVIFSSIYKKAHEFVNSDKYKTIKITGKKDENGKLIVSNIKPIIELNKNNIYKLASVI